MSPIPQTLAGIPHLEWAWDLVGAVRELMASAATSTAPVEDAREARALIERATVLLGERAARLPRPRPISGLADRAASGGVDVTIFPLNPQQVSLDVRIEGRTCSSAFTPRALHEGPPGYLHGGISASVLDTILGYLISAQGVVAFTHSLSVRYLRPTRLDVPLTVHGRITDLQGRKATALGWVEQEGVRTVEAEGFFVEPRNP